VEFQDFIIRERAIIALQVLQKGPKYVRELIKNVGGSNNTVLNRIKELIELGYAIETWEGNKRYIHLTETGIKITKILNYFIKPGEPTKRERWILAVLWGIGTDKRSKSIWGTIRIQKLLFLLQNDKNTPETALPYNFYPYKFGPFDADIIEDLRQLESKFLINIRPLQTQNKFYSVAYELTDGGANVARKIFNSFPRNIRDKIINLRYFNKLPFKELMRFIYENYPQYKKNADPEFIKELNIEDY